MIGVKDFIFHNQSEGIIPCSIIKDAAIRFGLSIRDVERICLENLIIPAKYNKNRNTISSQDQLTLFKSKIAVAGCGGLGQHAVESLARLGIGQILAIDPDVFEEHNLNRQIFSSIDNLGQPKVEAAFERVRKINPAVIIIPLKEAITHENGRELLKGYDLVIDGLDNISTRLALSEICADLEIPLVHGAIAGWYGHVSTQFPGDKIIQKIYKNKTHEKGIEKNLGNPSFTPAIVASIQVAEACKIILGKGQALKNRKIVIDLFDMEFHEVLF